MVSVIESIYQGFTQEGHYTMYHMVLRNTHLGDGLRDRVQHLRVGRHDEGLFHVLLLGDLVCLPLELDHSLLGDLDVHAGRDARGLAAGQSGLDALEVPRLNGRPVSNTHIRTHEFVTSCKVLYACVIQVIVDRVCKTTTTPTMYFGF